MGYSKCLQHVREPKKKSDSIFFNHPAGNRRTLLLQISERTCPNSINLYFCVPPNHSTWFKLKCPSFLEMFSIFYPLLSAARPVIFWILVFALPKPRL